MFRACLESSFDRFETASTALVQQVQRHILSHDDWSHENWGYLCCQPVCCRHLLQASVTKQSSLPGSHKQIADFATCLSDSL